MTIKSKIMLMVPLVVAACSTQATLPISGVFDGSKDRFLGALTGDSATGVGHFSVNSQNGAVCKGTYKGAPDGITGAGSITCADGRNGEFRFLSRGQEGEGFGKMQNGDTFSFKYGSPYHSEQRAREAEAFAKGLQSLGQGIGGSPSVNTQCFSTGGMTNCSTR